MWKQGQMIFLHDMGPPPRRHRTDRTDLLLPQRRAVIPGRGAMKQTGSRRQVLAMIRQPSPSRVHIVQCVLIDHEMTAVQSASRDIPQQWLVQIRIFAGHRADRSRVFWHRRFSWISQSGHRTEIPRKTGIFSDFEPGKPPFCVR